MKWGFYDLLQVLCVPQLRNYALNPFWHSG